MEWFVYDFPLPQLEVDPGWLKPISPSEPAWSPPDSRRSTLDLVQSCIFTLILCSWTAVHPDIPPQEKKRWWKYRKLLDALWAIVMPEYFLWLAFDELWESRLICLELKELESTRTEQSDSPEGKPAPTVQSLPESKDIEDVCPANPSHANPEMHGTNHQDQSRIAHAIGRFVFCGLWPIVYKTWRKVFPCELERGFYIEMGGYEIVSDSAEKVVLPYGFEGRVTSRGAMELAWHDLLPKVSNLRPD